jgi:alanine racemase
VTEPIAADTARAWVDVDLEALASNARAFGVRAGVPLLPVVKADAYGLGVGPVVDALEPLDPWGYGVGTVEEGEALRRGGVTRPVLVLSPMLPGLAARMRGAGLRPSLGDLEAVDAWLAQDPEAPFHVDLDTGMARSGFRWDDGERLDRLAERLATALGWEGAFTHFHSAEHDAPATGEQWDRFQGAVARLGRRPRYLHAANSAGGLLDARFAADLARPGLYLYGARVGGHVPAPVVSFRARVIATRRVRPGDPVSYGATWRSSRATTIVTVAAGYADGVPLALSNRGHLDIAGTRHPIVGRVTMDMTMADVGDDPVPPGAVATVFGSGLSLDLQAEAAGTIAYDLLTGIGPRVVRRYGASA